MPADVAVPAEGAFDAYAIQQKWQERWAEADPFRAGGPEDTRESQDACRANLGRPTFGP